MPVEEVAEGPADTHEEKEPEAQEVDDEIKAEAHEESEEPKTEEEEEYKLSDEAQAELDEIDKLHAERCARMEAEAQEQAATAPYG